MRSFLLTFCSLVLLSAIALAHGDGQWVLDDKMGQGSGWCCGKNDCVVQPAGAVERAVGPNGGYVVVATGQWFAEVGERIDGESASQRTYYSIDQNFWMCWYASNPDAPPMTVPPGINVPDGHIPRGRCLFVPAVGT